MELFLLFLLSVIGLGAYFINKNKKWKLFLKIFGIFISILVGIILLASLGEWYEDRPRPTSEIGSLKLGMTPVEVTLALGKPSDEFVDDSGKRKFIYFDYSRDIDYYVIFSNEETQEKASIICTGNTYREVSGLGVYDSKEEVLKKLGQPDKISINKTGTAEILSFSKFNVAFKFSKERVTEMCLTESGVVSFLEEYPS